jgi:acetyl-CoA carboxylase carboxyl transferase subunit alpha
MSDERTLDLLETKILELRELNKVDEIDLTTEIERLEKKLASMRKDLYANLSDWERVKLARHPKRPYALDYIGEIFSDFYELHGDRLCGDDRALLAGLAELDGQSIVIIAQQKGRSTQENKERYFGMTRPQGYRKARRTMALAERFSFPSTPRGLIQGWNPRKRTSEGQSRRTCSQWRNCASLRSPLSSVKGDRAGRWRLEWPIGC